MSVDDRPERAAFLALNARARRWRLNVGRDGDELVYYVSGDALPPGRRRGLVTFYGATHRHAGRAIVAGALALDEVVSGR